MHKALHRNPNPTIREIWRQARAQGFDIQPTKSGFKIVAPDGRLVSTHSTLGRKSGEWRAVRNFTAECRRIGLEVHLK